MRSDAVSVWQIIKHIFGYHTWGEWKDDAIDHPTVHYRNCELCGQEQDCGMDKCIPTGENG